MLMNDGQLAAGLSLSEVCSSSPYGTPCKPVSEVCQEADRDGRIIAGIRIGLERSSEHPRGVTSACPMQQKHRQGSGAGYLSCGVPMCQGSGIAIRVGDHIADHMKPLQCACQPAPCLLQGSTTCFRTTTSQQAGRIPILRVTATRGGHGPRHHTYCHLYSRYTPKQVRQDHYTLDSGR